MALIPAAAICGVSPFELARRQFKTCSDWIGRYNNCRDVLSLNKKGLGHNEMNSIQRRTSWIYNRAACSTRLIPFKASLSARVFALPSNQLLEATKQIKSNVHCNKKKRTT